MLDFVIEEKPGARSGNYGREWYEHKVAYLYDFFEFP